jgi:hypothetical protein
LPDARLGKVRVPVLPLVDLLILLGTGSLVIGFLLKAIAITTIYNPTLLGFSSTDFALIAALCMGFAVVLIGRTWLKLNEPSLALRHRQLREEAARQRAKEFEERNGALAQAEAEGNGEALASLDSRTAGAGRS